MNPVGFLAENNYNETSMFGQFDGGPTPCAAALAANKGPKSNWLKL